MAGRVQHRDLEVLADAHRVTRGRLHEILAAKAGEAHLGIEHVHARVHRGEQRLDLVDVVEVAVRAQDVGDLQVEFLGFAKDRRGVPRRIDDSTRARAAVPDQVDEVVPGTEFELVNEDAVAHQNIATLRMDSPSCIRSKRR